MQILNLYNSFLMRIKTKLEGRTRIVMKKILLLILCAAAPYVTIQASVREAARVFNRWSTIQQIIPDCLFQDLIPEINEQFARDFCRSYENRLPLLNKGMPFLKAFTNESIYEKGYAITWPLNEVFVKNLQTTYMLADKDIRELLLFFQSLNLFELKHDQSSFDGLIDQFNYTLELFFSGQPEYKKVEFMFNLANRYTEWLFGPNFKTVGQRMMTDKTTHQILRHLYGVIWQKLAGFGWKNWHQSALDNVAQEVAAGKTVIYIAGGSDIYQLIKNGVYNIVNIDPQLPTQPTYYTNDWEYILMGLPGDRIVFKEGVCNVTMIRRSYTKTGLQFQAKLSNNQTVIIDETETIWDIYNEAETQRLGSYTLKRRFSNQDDFITKPNEVLLMSFNEVYYVCMTEAMGGWGINPTQLPPNFMLYVKQLRKPVNREMLLNMHTAALLNSFDLGYIGLGSCIN